MAADLLADLDGEVAERIRARRLLAVIEVAERIKARQLLAVIPAAGPGPCAAVCEARAAGRPCEECRRDGESG